MTSKGYGLGLFYVKTIAGEEMLLILEVATLPMP
jgi:hypothetical protein